VNSKTSFDLFQSYSQLLKAKKLTYPDKITVSEPKAEVELQSLVDHTARRIVKLQHDVLESVGSDSSDNLILIGK